MTLASHLLAWYDAHARDLPWRRTKDPYHILVSEFMLQQTQVQTVIPYYRAFLKRFPTIVNLAESSVDNVLALWKGLGYYRRAQNLHRSAQILVENHNGILPGEYDAVRALPGVGDYTAAALLSIAHGQPYPVLDGNVARVTTRLLNLNDPVEKAATKRQMMAFLGDEIPRTRPGDFNQAMMELGATVCLPRGPHCTGCPLETMCLAQKEGRQEELPVKGVKTAIRTEARTVVVAHSEQRVFVVRRPDEGLLARMWEFPHHPGNGENIARQITREIFTDADEAAWEISQVGKVEHRFSHLIWRFDVVVANYRPLAGKPPDRPPSDVAESPAQYGSGWITPDEVNEIALPRVMQKVWDLATRSLSTGLPFELQAPSAKDS